MNKPSIDAPSTSLRPNIQVLERTHDLLHVLSQHNRALSLKFLAEQTGLNISTTHRILNDLVLTRLVDRPATGQYQLGMRLLELGNLVKARLNVRSVALPEMKALQRDIDETINLAIRQNDEIVYIERAYAERSGMQVVRTIGGHAPLHLTSTGKLFLATWDDDELAAYAQRTGLKPRTPNSINDLARLREQLSAIRHQQLAHDHEELENGVSCMAAGIYDDAHQLIAGLSISAPADRLQANWGARLLRATQQISRAMGAPA